MELTVGAVLEGKIKSITNFGAFVSLPENKTGMVHISEVANAYVSDIRQHLTEGQDVKVMVIGTENGKINLSIKRLEPKQQREGNGNFQRREGGSFQRREGGFQNREGGNFQRREGGFQNREVSGRVCIARVPRCQDTSRYLPTSGAEAEEEDNGKRAAESSPF